MTLDPDAEKARVARLAALGLPPETPDARTMTREQYAAAEAKMFSHFSQRAKVQRNAAFMESLQRKYAKPAT